MKKDQIIGLEWVSTQSLLIVLRFRVILIKLLWSRENKHPIVDSREELDSKEIIKKFSLTK